MPTHLVFGGMGHSYMTVCWWDVDRIHVRHKNDIRAWGTKCEYWPAILNRLSSIQTTSFGVCECEIANSVLL